LSLLGLDRQPSPGDESSGGVLIWKRACLAVQHANQNAIVNVPALPS
jgi:hypothetical protein